MCCALRLKESSEQTVRTLVDMEGSYLSANFFREIVAAESFSYDPNRPRPQFVTLTGAKGNFRANVTTRLSDLLHHVAAIISVSTERTNNSVVSFVQ